MRPLFLAWVTGLPTVLLCDGEGKEIILRLPPSLRCILEEGEGQRERESGGDDKEEDEETTISPIADRRYPCGYTITLCKPILLLPRHALPCVRPRHSSLYIYPFRAITNLFNNSPTFVPSSSVPFLLFASILRLKFGVYIVRPLFLAWVTSLPFSRCVTNKVRKPSSVYFPPPIIFWKKEKDRERESGRR